MNMRKWLDDMRAAKVKKAMPVLSFPSVQLLGITVRELISDSDMQSRGMKLITDRTDAAASVSMMDLSVEAEAFGSVIRITDDEVPTVVGHIIENEEQAEALAIPEAGAGRTGLYVESIKKACGLIRDRPVFAGTIGPFSLAGRLLDVSQSMIYCYEEPDMVHAVLSKTADFIAGYMEAYKAAGANGAVMAEPLAGMLTPGLNGEFSAAYVKQIIDRVQTEDFAVIYHNCGVGALKMADEIFGTGAAAFHFGNAIDMEEMLKLAPPETVVMGNVDPAGRFMNGTPESVRDATVSLLEKCHKYPNFIISSGCDIPPMSGWENIDAFFAAVKGFYEKL